jgi:hypothetical protein
MSLPSIAAKKAAKQARLDTLASVGNDKEALVSVYVPVPLPNGEFHYEWQQVRRTEHPDQECARAQKEGRFKPEQEISRTKPAMFATKGLKTTDKGLPWGGIEHQGEVRKRPTDPLTKAQRLEEIRRNPIYKSNRTPRRNKHEAV